MTLRNVFLVTTALLIGVGCGATRQTSYQSETTAAKETKETTAEDEKMAQADELWAKRDDPKTLRELLTIYEEILEADPSNRQVLERLSRGYYIMAYGYLTDNEEILAAYDKGASFGERILGLNSEFRDRVANGEDDYKILGITTKEDVPGIYWAYVNLGKWSVLKGFTTVLKNKSKLKAFIDRVAQLDPDYYYSAADRGLGAFYAKAPSFAGGDLDKSKTHFDSSLNAAPDYFSTKIAMAEYYAVKSQDRELFEKLLDEVINGDPNAVPDAIPIQKIEQQKAKALLARTEDLFE
ncbi:MAG: hypothetical protein GY847_19525 [Proteobacteria bacterium]|nr:hypothetical protein [Pseudomonadota bacterium]